MPHIAFNIITILLSILIKKIDDDGQIGRVVTNLVERMGCLSSNR
jgi:hypothetical protein